MSAEMTLFKGALPSYIKGLELDDTTKELAGGGGGSKRISIRGSVFRMIVGGKEVAQNEDRAMNIIVVNAAAKVMRQYYGGVFKEDAPAAPPKCWSVNGDSPDMQVPAETKQAKTCADCPQNIKGSGAGDTRACKFSRRLAVVLDNDIEGGVYQLSLPAQSIFGDEENGRFPLQAYAKQLAGFGVPITTIVTEARFDTGSSTPKLTFKAVRPLTEEEYAACAALKQTPEALQAISFTVAQTDGVRKIAAPVAAEEVFEQKPQVKVKPKAVEVPEVAAVAAVEEVAEPKKRGFTKTAPAAPPANKAKIDAVLAAWDDED